MSQQYFVDTTADYQDRQKNRLLGYAIIFILILAGIFAIYSGFFKIGGVLILIGLLFGWMSYMGDKKLKKKLGRA